MTHLMRTAVVGTTSDYIDLLGRKAPGKLIFITDTDIRRTAVEPAPQADEELLCDLSRVQSVIDKLSRHLRDHRITLNGITCFDCESMMLTAQLATAFNLPWHSPDTIQTCRDKSLTRQCWTSCGIDTPRAQRVSSPETAAAFFTAVESPCVLKPLDGSGSERVFLCRSADECKTSLHTICRFQSDPHAVIETFVSGSEYSCDILISPGGVTPLRFTRKISSPIAFFGTIMGYELVDFPRGNLSEKGFLKLMKRAADALYITQGICMVDFIVTENGVSLLEMTPRPGGDCLPWLLQAGQHLDTLKVALDAAADPHFSFTPSGRVTPLVGLRIHARKAGILKDINTNRLMKDTRVHSVHLGHRPGHRIALPPRDYDSWNLGHIIFKPSPRVSCEDQCLHLLSLLTVDIREQHLSGIRNCKSQEIIIHGNIDPQFIRHRQSLRTPGDHRICRNLVHQGPATAPYPGQPRPSLLPV